MPYPPSKVFHSNPDTMNMMKYQARNYTIKADFELIKEGEFGLIKSLNSLKAEFSPTESRKESQRNPKQVKDSIHHCCLYRFNKKSHKHQGVISKS